MNALVPLRWSHLKHMGNSAAHYRYFLENPVKETDSMRLGSRVHDLVLKGGRNRFAIWEGGNRSGLDWKLFAAAHIDATILTANQEENAQAIATAVLCNDEAMAALFGCVTEQRRTWSIAGRECEGTPDAVGPSSVTDLKITNDTSPGRFPWHARRMGWLGQISWYDFGAFAGQAERLTLIAAPNVPPFDPKLVTVYRLTPDAAEMGHRIWRSHFERLRVCEESDSWPGYSDCVVPFEVDQDFTLHMNGEEISVE
jgi:hypothetical protein